MIRLRHLTQDEREYLAALMAYRAGLGASEWPTFLSMVPASIPAERWERAVQEHHDEAWREWEESGDG